MKKRKKNLTKAEQAALDSFKKMQAKWDNMPKFGRGPAPANAEAKVVAAYVPSSRPTEGGHVKADFNSLKGSTSVKSATQYTGKAVLGVATMHKSNPVPVFSTDEARDVSTMRMN